MLHPTRLSRPARLPLLLGAALLGAALLLPATGNAADTPRLRLATTTSVSQSGLLDTLMPVFHQRCGCRTDVIAVGTGQALETARRGDVDAVLVHARAEEEQFVADGYGEKRVTFMQNGFVLIGPASDPADTRHAGGVVAALRRIATGGAPFLSRGDGSGTHIREKFLWGKAGVTPIGDWYRDVGQGMAGTLTMADQLSAYTLTDRATFLQNRKRLKLEILVDGSGADGGLLENPYSVIAVNPARHPHVNNILAHALVTWLSGPEARGMIEAFAVDGEHPFTPLTPAP